jgi:hypothetical protein
MESISLIDSVPLDRLTPHIPIGDESEKEYRLRVMDMLVGLPGRFSEAYLLSDDEILGKLEEIKDRKTGTGNSRG